MKTLAFDLPLGTEASRVDLEVAGRKVEAKHTMRQHRVVITLASPLVLQAGETLDVELELAR